MSHPSDGDRPRALADAMPVRVPVAPAPPPEPEEAEPARPSGWDVIAEREADPSPPKSPRGWSRLISRRKATGGDGVNTDADTDSDTDGDTDGDTGGWSATATRSSSDEWESLATWDDDDFSPPIGAGHAESGEIEAEPAAPEPALAGTVAQAEAVPAAGEEGEDGEEGEEGAEGDEGEEGEEAEEEPAVEDDYDVYDARSPIRSNRDAWLGVAWVLVFTALVGWATHLFADKPDDLTAQGGSVKLQDIRVADSAGPSGPVSTNEGARKIKISVIKPDTLGGRARSSENQPEAPDYLSAYTDGEIVSGAYGEFEDQNLVLMSAVTSAHLLYPDSQFVTLLDQLQADDPNLVDPQPVPAGTLAGIARCGESKFGDKPKSVCFWADEQCMGVITWFDQPIAKAMEEFLALREQIEHPL